MWRTFKTTLVSPEFTRANESTLKQVKPKAYFKAEKNISTTPKCSPKF